MVLLRCLLLLQWLAPFNCEMGAARAWRVRSSNYPLRGQWGLHKVEFFKSTLTTEPGRKVACHGALSSIGAEIIASDAPYAENASINAFSNDALHLGRGGRAWLSGTHTSETPEDHAWIGLRFPSAVKVTCVRLYQNLFNTLGIDLQRMLGNGSWVAVHSWRQDALAAFDSFSWLTLAVATSPFQAFRECPRLRSPVEALKESSQCCVWPQLAWHKYSATGNDTPQHGLVFFAAEQDAHCTPGATVFHGRQCSIWSSRCASAGSFSCENGNIAFSVSTKWSRNCMCEELFHSKHTATAMNGMIWENCTDPFASSSSIDAGENTEAMLNSSDHSVSPPLNSSDHSMPLLVILLITTAALAGVCCIVCIFCYFRRKRYGSFKDEQLSAEDAQVVGSSQGNLI